MRVVLVCKYDGSNYHGFQIQPNNITVQELIEKSLKRIHKGKDVRIHMSGRTDSGVHAYCQPIHFDTELNISDEGWIRSVNAYLPKDIRIISAINLGDSDFHVRFNSIEKTYEYKLFVGRYVDPFLVNYVGHYPLKFDYSRALECIPYFLGEHDFSAFCSKNSSIENKIRTIYDFKINKIDDIVTFEITGDGFLYNMVRIIVGTIIDVAHGKYEKDYIDYIFSSKDRSLAGKRADASGLYLKNIKYDNDLVNDFLKKINKT